MLAQCWCYQCAGRIVTRKTFNNHGRKNKPDEPERKIDGLGISLPEVVAQHADADASLEEVDDSTQSEDTSGWPTDDSTDSEDAGRPSGAGRSNLSSQEVLLLFLDWMASHKTTDSSASQMWMLFNALLPENVRLPTFWWVKRLLRNNERKFVVRIEICPNDCIAYWNSKHLSTPYRHAHRTKCPVCNHPRYLKDPVDGKSRPAKVVYHFPIKSYIRALFSRADLVPYLYTDCGDRPEGAVTRSRGFRSKILDNPHMNKDHRNIGLIGTTDGVPFFEDQRRNAWPFVLRCANLPDAMSTHAANCHLAMLSASEYWEHDTKANRLRRRIRAPKSLQPHLTIIVDDLLAAYKRGVRVSDYAAPTGSVDRRFWCRACLLYWCGDYPAQALVSGTHSKTCHWCTLKSVHAPEVSRRCWGTYRRYLPSDHPFRVNPDFGCVEERPAPATRTHAEFVEDARANERWRGANKDAPYKSSGVKQLSPLVHLPLFDIVWDILPDLMHIISGIWKRHIIELLKGTRTPAPVKDRKSLSAAENAQLQREYTIACAQLKTWSLDKTTGEMLDTRSRALAGEPSWIRSDLEVFSKGNTLKAHDWIRLVQDAGDYLLHDLFPDDPKRSLALYDLLSACNGCLTLTSPFDSENREVLDRLKLKVTEALSRCESVLPKTELAVMFHVLLHVPDAMYKWNAVRNFWAFFGERMMGYYIRFIHNRDLAAENIVTSCVRTRTLMFLQPMWMKQSFYSRLESAKVQLPDNSFLLSAKQVCVCVHRNVFLSCAINVLLMCY